MELVHRDAADGVATITLDSPRNRNALSAQVRRELQDHLDAAVAAPAVRVIVLTHTGPVFCSGMDLTESRGTTADQQGVNEFPRILRTIRTSPTPVVARVAGPARAGGVGLIAACDLAVATESATFANLRSAMRERMSMSRATSADFVTIPTGCPAASSTSRMRRITW